MEALEACLCSMRFVWTSLTDVGGGVCFRRAAAAADEERFALEVWEARKAWTAAVWADGEGLEFTG